MPLAKPCILFLITTADWGGAQNFVFQTARECRNRGMRILVAAGDTGELEGRCQIEGIPYRQLKAMKRTISPFHDLAALHEIRLLIRETRPTTIHLNSSKMGVIGSFAAHLERVPRVIYRIGGWAFLENIGKFKRAIYLWSERWSAKYKDVIVTVHPGDEIIAKDLGIQPRGRLLTIPNGIDVSSFDCTLMQRDAARKELGVDEKDFVIGSVTNFYPAKNIPWYIESMAPLLREHENMKLVIIGDGPDRDKVEKVVANCSVNDRVILAGRRANAVSLLPAFDIFVLPSSKEGMPWALLEAMAARLPCIATDVGACRWMLEPDAGIIVPLNDAAALKKAIINLLSDTNRSNSLGSNARKTIETRFLWETAIDKTMELLSTTF